MRRSRILCVALLAMIAMTARAEEENPIHVEAGTAVVQVNGIVCSFCAQGVEKKLSKLDAIDSSRFRNGVLVDIENQRVTLALRSKTPIPFGELYEAIRKGGYEPERFHVRIVGTPEKSDGGLLLRDRTTGQSFLLAAAAVPEGVECDVQAYVDARVVSSSPPDDPVPASLDPVSNGDSGHE